MQTSILHLIIKTDEMKRSIILLTSLLVGTLSALSQVRWGTWQTWGEQADGTYRNPVVPADYSDLDCIRVGDDYYVPSVPSCSFRPA